MFEDTLDWALRLSESASLAIVINKTQKSPYVTDKKSGFGRTTINYHTLKF